MCKLFSDKIIKRTFITYTKDNILTLPDSPRDMEQRIRPGIFLTIFQPKNMQLYHKQNTFDRYYR